MQQGRMSKRSYLHNVCNVIILSLFTNIINMDQHIMIVYMVYCIDISWYSHRNSHQSCNNVRLPVLNIFFGSGMGPSRRPNFAELRFKPSCTDIQKAMAFGFPEFVENFCQRPW